MKQLKELTPKEIFDIVHKFCVLSDIDPPQDDQSLKMMIDFIKQNHGNFDARILDWSFDIWLQGDIDVTRPRRINAYFVSQVIKKSVKEGLIKYPYPPKAPKLIPSKVLDEKENDELQKRVYHQLYEHFVAYKRSKDVRLVLKMLEVQYNYIDQFVDNMQYINTFLQDMTEDVMIYHKFKEKTLSEENKLYHWNAIQKTIDVPKVDLNKVSRVWAHFTLKYEDEYEKLI